LTRLAKEQVVGRGRTDEFVLDPRSRQAATGRRNIVSTPTSISIPKLSADVSGRVIGPDDAEYDKARAVFYGGFDLHPAVVVRVADEVDIARVIALARETGLELAVKSGGHSVIGQGVSDGGIVIDLADLRSIEVDPGERTAWAQTGL